MQMSKAIWTLARPARRQVESIFRGPAYLKFQYNSTCGSACTLSYSVNGRIVNKNSLRHQRSCLSKVKQLCAFSTQHIPVVTVSGNDVAEPCESFSDTHLDSAIIMELEQSGFTKPTTIQSRCLPVAMSGRDVVGIGQTGSGKTLAYILPALAHIKQRDVVGRRTKIPKALVLAPTRELAQQIQQVADQFSKVCHMRTTCLFGGVSKGPQIRDLEHGVDICIGTPGRLIDVLEMGALNLSECEYLVLDEADRMLDMGFEPQIKRIIPRIPPHQTLMWSATWPQEIRALANEFLKDFIQITVGSEDLMANPNIKQVIEVCSESDKERLILRTLEKIITDPNAKVLLFAKMKRQVDDLTRMLVWNKIPATCIHGDKSQVQRDMALRDFRFSRKSILVATDVAARGLDISDITHVVNYSFPNTVEDYVHRIGRTARGERSGSSHTFFTDEHNGLAKELVAVLKEANQEINPELLRIAQTSFPSKSSSYNQRRRSGSADRYFNNNRRDSNRDSFGRKPSYRRNADYYDDRDDDDYSRSSNRY